MDQVREENNILKETVLDIQMHSLCDNPNGSKQALKEFFLNSLKLPSESLTTSHSTAKSNEGPMPLIVKFEHYQLRGVTVH